MHARHRIGVTLALLGVVIALPARAQLREDALVQAPEIARPARGTLGSALAGFELGPAALARGSSALPSPFVAPEERGSPAVPFFPAYLADRGISEWGMGWASPLSIRRTRTLGPLDYETDRFVSPWGPLSRGSDGSYYVDGLSPRVRISQTQGGFRAVDEHGTRYEFRASDAHETPRGTYEWWLGEAASPTGERTRFTYEAAVGGRRYLTRVTYGGREGVALTEVTLAYEPLPVPYVDRRAGSAVRLDRRVSRVTVAQWDPASGGYLERYRYELGHTLSPAGVAHYLTSVRQVFASGEAAPVVRYHYRFGEEDARTAVLREAPDLSRYLAVVGPGCLAPSKASYLDVDRDGRLDIESAYDQQLARHTEAGFRLEPLPRDGTESPLCRPQPSATNQPRTLVRLAPGRAEVSVLRLVRRAADTQILACDRQGHVRATTTLEGDYRLGPNTRLADVDRDLRPDLVRVSRGRLELRKNVSESGLAFAAPVVQELTPAISASRSWVLDMTADGVADLVAVVRAALFVWPGLGDGRFEREAERLPLVGLDGGELGSIEDSGVAFVDANRDGLSDVLVSKGPVLRLLTRRGTHFAQIEVPAFAELRWDYSYPLTLDLEGTGEEQAVVTAGTTAYAISFTSPSAGLLVAADDGRGGRIALSYERAPPTPGIAVRPPLVSRLSVHDAGSDVLEHRFDYHEPAFHSESEHLLGYRKVRRSGPTSVDEVDLHHDGAQRALVLGTRRFDLASAALAAGLHRFTERRYERTRFLGLSYLRPRAERAGLRDASGASLEATARTTLLFSEDGLCPLTVRAARDGAELLITRTLASPAGLGGALHCMPASEEEVGLHPAHPEHDFVHRVEVERDTIGQPREVALASEAGRTVVQAYRYDPFHRLIALRGGGRAETSFAYEPVTGALSAVRTPDGVVVTARARDPRTDAPLAVEEERGGLAPYTTEYRYDGLERLSARFDNVGTSSAALPDETLTYAFASSDRPASIEHRALFDDSAGPARDAEWLTASGTTLATGSAIPEGWALSTVTRAIRARAEVEQHHRLPVTTVDAHAVSLAALFDPARSTRLARRRSSPLGHASLEEALLQVDVTRRVTRALRLDGASLAYDVGENGEPLATEHVDGDGRRVRTVDAAGEATEIAYDALGRAVSVLLPGGARQIRTFDALGRVARVAREGLGEIAYDYEPETGLLAEERVLDADGAAVRRTRHRYDAAGREVERTHAAEQAESTRAFRFHYDGQLPDEPALAGQQGRATAVIGPGHHSRTLYRPDGLVAQRELSLLGFRRIRDSYAYFEDGLVRRHEREIADDHGRVLETSVRERERDAYGRDLRLRIRPTPDAPLRLLYELRYDAEGRIERVILGGREHAAPSGAHAVTPRYDEATHAARGYLHVAPGWSLDVTGERDARGLLRSERIRLEAGAAVPSLRDRHYHYDLRRFLEQMTSADDAAAYAYEPSGLLRAITDLAGERRLARTPRELAAGARTYRFDAAGRLTARDDLELRYGADGQLAEASRAGRVLTFVYDEAGRRLLKRRNGVPVAAYVDGALLTEHGIVEPLVVGGRAVGVVAGGTLHPIPTDPRGSVVGEGADYLSFSPYGVRAHHPAHAEALAFAAHGHDVELDLVRMGARDYDPYLGQFTTPDPLLRSDLDACATRPVECNLFGYAANDPVGAIDPSGTIAESPWDAINLGLGVHSLVSNLRSGNYGSAIVDGAGVLGDGLALVVPGVPGGAATAIHALRHGDQALGVAGSVAALQDEIAHRASGTAPPGAVSVSPGGSSADALAMVAARGSGRGGASRAGGAAMRGGPQALISNGYRAERFASDKLFDSHFAKHASEWGAGNITKAGYLKRARDLLGRPVGGDIVGATRANGDILRYNVRTNEFAVGAADGTIRTLFRPERGRDYWRQQTGAP